MHTAVPAALALAAFGLLAGPALAHGGQYRGPATGAPDLGTPSGPVTPGASVAGGPTTGGNATLDINSWQVWWQLHQDHYVGGNRRRAGDAERRAIALPVLQLALERGKDPDVLSASLIALGKTAVDHPDIDALAVLLPYLSHAHLEVRDAAVLALGLTARAEAADMLGDLLLDTRDGRRLVGRSRVGDRAQVFAAYGLGILAGRSDAAALKAKALDPLVAALADKSPPDRDVLTAVLNGIRLIDADPARSAAHKRVLWTALAALESHQQQNLKEQMAVVQSHGLTALAWLARRAGEADQARVRELVLAALQRRDADGAICVSATIALGLLARPEHTDALETLTSHVLRPRDSLVPRFCMIAFGQIGGEHSLQQLTKVLTAGERDLKPWAALGLGLLAFAAKGAADPQAQATARDWRGEVGRLLQRSLEVESSREVIAALGLGLGLAGETAAAPKLRQLATDWKGNEDLKGLLCVALAMLEDQPSVPIASDAMSTIERPVLFGHGARALARFGQQAASANAMAALAAESTLRPGYLSRLGAAAQALGHLQNPDDLPALAQVIRAALEGRRRSGTTGTDLQAAFAAAALGAIADRDDLGFGARIAHGMNYTVRETTVSNGKNGILDIF